MKVIKTIPLGIAYDVWTGIGVIGTVIVGNFVFKEVVNFWKLFLL